VDTGDKKLAWKNADRWRIGKGTATPTKEQNIKKHPCGMHGYHYGQRTGTSEEEATGVITSEEQDTKGLSLLRNKIPRGYHF
jgi:hypothetical protein